MIDLRDKSLVRYIPNADLILVVPAEMGEEDFMKFRTSLGVAMEAIKRKHTGLDKMAEEKGSIQIDKETAVFLENVASIKVNRSKTGDTFMMESSIVKELKKQVCTLIGGLKKTNMSEDEILEIVKKDFPYVPLEYAKHVLAMSDEELNEITFNRQINSIYQRFGEEEVLELLKE